MALIFNPKMKMGNFGNRQLPKHLQHHRKQLRGTVYEIKKNNKQKKQQTNKTIVNTAQ